MRYCNIVLIAVFMISCGSKKDDPAKEVDHSDKLSDLKISRINNNFYNLSPIDGRIKSIESRWGSHRLDFSDDGNFHSFDSYYLPVDQVDTDGLLRYNESGVPYYYRYRNLLDNGNYYGGEMLFTMDPSILTNGTGMVVGTWKDISTIGKRSDDRIETIEYKDWNIIQITSVSGTDTGEIIQYEYDDKENPLFSLGIPYFQYSISEGFGVTSYSYTRNNFNKITRRDLNGNLKSESILEMTYDGDRLIQRNFTAPYSGTYNYTYAKHIKSGHPADCLLGTWFLNPSYLGYNFTIELDYYSNFLARIAIPESGCDNPYYPNQVSTIFYDWEFIDNSTIDITRFQLGVQCGKQSNFAAGFEAGLTFIDCSTLELNQGNIEGMRRRP